MENTKNQLNKEQPSFWKKLKINFNRVRFYRKQIKTIKAQVIYEEYLARLSKAKYEKLMYDVQYLYAQYELKSNKDGNKLKEQRAGKKSPARS